MISKCVVACVRFITPGPGIAFEIAIEACCEPIVGSGNDGYTEAGN